MKTKSTLEMKWLAFCIEWHWWFIMRGRRKCNRLFDAGNKLSYPKMLVLNKHLSRHCVKVMSKTKRYEDLAGITDQLNRSSNYITNERSSVG